ncbi:MAG: TonB-dependent receptor [Pseudomonadota bacterium]
MRGILYRGLAVSSFTIVSANAISAQTALPSDLEQERVFETVYVEAQRKEEALLDVPISVSVISADTIANAKISNLVDLTGLTPNFNINTTASRTNPNLFIRGVGGIATVDPGSVQSVAVFVDGVYIPFTSAALFEFLDVERVEILRGPQGTLFGRNATSGAVNVITRTADPEFGGNVEIEAGNLEFFKAIGSINAPFGGDGDGLRISGLWNQRDGFVDNAIGDNLDAEASNALRARLSLSPTQNLSFDVAATYEEINDSGYAYVLLADTFDRQYDTPLDSFDDRQSWSGSFKARYEIGKVLLTSTTAYQSYDSETANPQDVLFGFPAQDLGFTLSTEVENGTSWSQEFLLQSDASSPFDWTVGGFLSRTDVTVDTGSRFTEASGFPFGFQAFSSPTQNETDIFAIFADVSFPLATNLEAKIGGRYTSESVDWNTSSVVDGFTLPNSQRSDSEDFSVFTPRFVLDYKLEPNFSTYVSAARGFRAGGFTTFNAGGPAATYNPEFVWTYELGAKYQNLDQTLVLSGAAFYNDWTDLHVFYLTTANEITQRLVENAEGARTYGVEGELRWLPTERWEFSGSIGWVDAKLTDVSNPFDGQRLAENRVPLASEWTAGLSGQYVQPISDAINLRLRADLTYAGPYFFDTLNTQRQDGVALLNLSGALETEHVSFGIHVKNAFDEDYYRWRFNSGGRDFGAAAEPLSALAFIRSRF